MSLNRTSDSIYSEYLEAQHREAIEQAEAEKVPVQSDPTERRGTRYKDAKTGAMVKLNGKVKEVAFNRYEYDLLEQAATASGATVTSFMRAAIMKAVKAELSTISA